MPRPPRETRRPPPRAARRAPAPPAAPARDRPPRDKTEKLQRIGGLPVARLAGDRPVALILGNEEEGLGAATLAACDEVVTIPGSGRVQSLNVSAAAAILIH